MPNYEYKCEQCDTHYEVIKPLAEYGTIEICPVHQQAMSRVWTVPAMMLVSQRRDPPGAYCIGNEKPKNSFTPKAAEYTLPREVLATFED